MKNKPTRQALADDIKREVLMDLNRSRTIHSGRDREMIENIKQEILLELDQSQPHFNPPYLDRTFMEAIKNEVLDQIQYEMRQNMAVAGTPPYPSRAAIESIKREVIAQMEADREAQEEQITVREGEGREQEGLEQGQWRGPGQGRWPRQYHMSSDPALVQAIKNSVLAEMNMHSI